MYCRILFTMFFLLMSCWGLAQIKGKGEKQLQPTEETLTGRQLSDTIGGSKFEEESKVELSGETHYTDYKIILHSKDTLIIDTTLSLKKERKFNYIRRNNFELMPLHNLGQTFNHLAYDFNKATLFPQMGFRAKYFNFYDIKDVRYYRTPTPTTELFFKTGIQQGQMLNSMFTVNFTPRLNFSIAYKGLRSLGDYRSALASHQNFRVTTNFEGKKKRYRLRMHYVAHNLLNEENGGLTEESLQLFTSDDEDTRDRERLEVEFTDTESTLKGKRYYIEQSYAVWQRKDKVKQKTSHLRLGHEFVHSRRYYTFDQNAANDYFGTAYQKTIADSTYYRTTSNSLFMELKAPWILGAMQLKTNYSHFNYGYNGILFLNDQTIPEKLKGNNLSVEASWDAGFKTFSLKSKVGAILRGHFFKGNYITGTASYSKDSLFTAKATLLVKSQSPNFNFLLHQSTYEDYNWYKNFENERTRYLGFSFESDRWVDASASITHKDFYTYFDTSSQPQQYKEALSYLKIKAHKAIRYGKFTLDNTLMYQQALAGSDVFRVPEWVTENTLYFSDHVFKGDPLYIQTGFNFKYFTKYYAQEFNPLLNEFVLQNTTEIGNYPMVDFFVNGLVRRTRLFFKIENITSFWTGRNYFATPTHPYRDFKIRFGVVWNFFI